MTAEIRAETMIGDNEQKKDLVFNLFKLRGSGGHTPGSSNFAYPNTHAYDIPGS